jgi:hypothetical protein
MKKMKKYIILFAFIGQLIQAQQIENVKAELVGDNIIVSYDLLGSPENNYAVYVYCSSDNYLRPLQQLSGVWGNKVKPGLAQKVIWDFTRENMQLAQNLNFKVEANLNNNNTYQPANLQPLNKIGDSTEDMCKKGETDALQNYQGLHSGAGFSGVMAVIASPLIGFIPAIACSSVEPQTHNLSCPQPELLKNTQYSQCYREKAHKMKKRKVWSGYAIGAGVWVALVATLMVAYGF